MRNLSFVAIGIVSSASVFADTSVWLGADVGATTGLVNSDYLQQTKEVGLSVDLGSVNDSRMNWSVALGVDINPFFSNVSLPVFLTTELEYFDMGEVNLDYTSHVAAADRDVMNEKMLNIHPKSGKGGALSLITRFSPVNRIENWQLGLRLGGAYWRQDYQVFDGNVVAGTQTLSGVGALAGLQTSYQITEYFLTKVEWKVQQFDDELSHSATLGFEFRPMALFNHKGNEKLPRPSAKPMQKPTPKPMVPSLTPTPLIEDTKEIKIPQGQKDQFSVEQNTRLVMDVLANDFGGEGIYISRIESGGGGVVSFSDGESDYGQLLYQHNGGIQTQDVFYYWLMDGMNEHESEAIAVTMDITNILLPDTFNLRVLFTSGSIEIEKQYFTQLDQYVELLKQNVNVHSTIEGHTDSEGNASVNILLSTQRAQAVANYLMQNGVSSERLTVKGLGAQYPIADNATAEGRAENRRIVIMNNIK
jgi:outer membrane protein OmpA-like peptidoglycan-associated protein